MSKYGSGLTFNQVCQYEREAIIQAIDNKKVINETEEGFEYGECSKEEAKEIILDAYDEACYQAKQAFAFNRAEEAFLKQKMGEEWYQQFTKEFIHSGMIEKETFKEDK